MRRSCILTTLRKAFLRSLSAIFCLLFLLPCLPALAADEDTVYDDAFFAAHGVTVERVLTDNGACCKSKLFTQSLTAAGIAHKKIRPYRPQTNGKVERFNRTLLDEWAYLRPYTSNHERTTALADFLHTYNHHRCHTALGGQPPISRVNNAAGQYT